MCGLHLRFVLTILKRVQHYKTLTAYTSKNGGFRKAKRTACHQVSEVHRLYGESSHVSKIWKGCLIMCW